MFPLSVTRVGFMVCVQGSPIEPPIWKETLNWGLRLYCHISEIVINSIFESVFYKVQWEHGACVVDLWSWILWSPSSRPIYFLGIGFKYPLLYPTQQQTPLFTPNGGLDVDVKGQCTVMWLGCRDLGGSLLAQEVFHDQKTVILYSK